MGTVSVRRCTACEALTAVWGPCRMCGAFPGEKWTEKEQLGTTPELLALSESTCDCDARIDGGSGHEPGCAFYLAVANEYGWNHPLVVGAFGSSERP
jgi:hypothetical protein